MKIWKVNNVRDKFIVMKNYGDDMFNLEGGKKIFRRLSLEGKKWNGGDNWKVPLKKARKTVIQIY